MAQKAGKYAAAVGCSGGELARRRIPREALTGDCRQALAEHPEGILECRWGCLGLGSCAAVCKLGAIKVGARGVAEVARDKCVVIPGFYGLMPDGKLQPRQRPRDAQGLRRGLHRLRHLRQELPHGRHQARGQPPRH